MKRQFRMTTKWWKNKGSLTSCFLSVTSTTSKQSCLLRPVMARLRQSPASHAHLSSSCQPLLLPPTVHCETKTEADRDDGKRYCRPTSTTQLSFVTSDFYFPSSRFNSWLTQMESGILMTAPLSSPSSLPSWHLVQLSLIKLASSRLRLGCVRLKQAVIVKTAWEVKGGENVWYVCMSGQWRRIVLSCWPYA